MNSDKKNRGIIVFLLLLLVIIGILSFQNARDYSELQKVFVEEKKELELELNKIITDYDGAITAKINISKRLAEERDRVILLRDSIVNLKEKNYSFIRRYRRRISNLEKQNRLLFTKVDSLSGVTNNLHAQNVAVKRKLTQKNKLSNSLAQENEDLQKSKETLEATVAVAKELKTTNLSVIPLKRRNSGKYATTSRSRKVEAFKIVFDILKNDIAQPGKRKIYVQLLDKDFKVISPDGSTTLKNGTKLVYSGVFTANYSNEKTSTISILDVEKGEVKKGKYIINTYMEGDLIGNRILNLK